jgi:tetratricopeptide (TPR) repeat protein
MGQIEEAKEIYLKLVDFRKQKSLRNLNSATCYNDLGVICERLCQFEDAFKYKQMAMEIIESCEGDNDELKVTIYNNLGIAYENMQNFSEGTKFKEKALKLAIENFGENDIKTANTYNNLGISYENLGEYGKALEWKLKAHKIYECSVEVN